MLDKDLKREIHSHPNENLAQSSKPRSDRVSAGLSKSERVSLKMHLVVDG